MTQNQKDSHFESLPTELLLEVFDYLDAKSLKNCCEMSKRFHDIIGTSSRCMLKLPLYIDSKIDSGKTDYVWTRKYVTLMMMDINLEISAANMLKSHSALQILQIIEMDGCSVDSRGFKELIKELKLLQKIIISECYHLTNFKNRELIEVPSIKTLIFLKSDFKFLEFIGKNSIQKFLIHVADLKSNDAETLEEFLMRSSSLESLALRVKNDLIFSCLLNDDEKGYNFKLTEFSVTYGYFNQSENNAKFIGILEQHKETLEYLEVDCKLTKDTYEFIFKNLKLKSLKIDGRHLPTTALFYNAIAPNIYLKKLVVTEDINEGLFKIFRNIQDLTILKWENLVNHQTLISIGNNLKNLTTLKIPSIPEDPPVTTIKTLQYLHIDCLNTVNLNSNDFLLSIHHLQRFVSNLINIRHISFKYIGDDFDEDSINGITSHLPLLESITFGPHFELNERMLEIIKINSPKLHTINIFKSSENAAIPTSTTSLPRIFYFSNESSSHIFHSEPSMWTCCENYNTSKEELISDSEDSEVDYDDDDDDNYNIAYVDDHYVYNYF